MHMASFLHDRIKTPHKEIAVWLHNTDEIFAFGCSVK